jgi:Icc-related predicted phosphoesterase
MKITAISDTHGHLPDIESTVCPMYSHQRYEQRRWLENEFSDWLAKLPAEHIIGIGGNHDFALEHYEALGKSLPWTYLKDEATTVDGVIFYGSPWVPNLPRWAFHQDEDGLRYTWSTIPKDVNVLITHGPPAGFGDRVLRIHGSESTHHVGCPMLMRQYAHINPYYHFFGHIHEDRGVWSLGRDRFGLTLANVSMVDAGYDRDDRVPMEFNI